MTAPLLTIAECDRRLLAVNDEYHAAINRGDLDSADAAYELLDHLLELRIHLPQQRHAHQ